jgi:phenylalanyl-tRNA synthetase beta chain
VRTGTTNVLLECALFDPKTIRTGRRLLDMSTDASYRFERGIDPDGMERAVRRAVELIVATAGGTVEASVPFVDAGIPEIPPIRVRAARAERVLGVPVSEARIADLLEPIGFERVEGTTDTYRVPGHRRDDVLREVDLIEEIARREGYDSFPDDLRSFRPSVVPDDPMAHLEDRLRTLLVAQGLLEARSSPFSPDSEGDVELLLPLSTTEGRLRRALLPGLLRRLEGNYNRGARDVRLFEIGTVFAPGAEALPHEETRLAVLLTGARRPAHWSGEVPSYDLWDLRGLAEAVADLIGATLEPEGANAILAADAIFTLVSPQGASLGTAGRVRDEAVDSPAWGEPVFGLELVLDVTMLPERAKQFRPLPAHPPVERDLALVVPVKVRAGEIEKTIADTAGPLLEAVHPFDLYVGQGVPAGARSLAFRLRFRAADRTLTDAEVDVAVARVLSRLREEHNVERR